MRTYAELRKFKGESDAKVRLYNNHLIESHTYELESSLLYALDPDSGAMGTCTIEINAENSPAGWKFDSFMDALKVYLSAKGFDLIGFEVLPIYVMPRRTSRRRASLTFGANGVTS